MLKETKTKKNNKIFCHIFIIGGISFGGPGPPGPPSVYGYALEDGSVNLHFYISVFVVIKLYHLFLLCEVFES